MKKGAATTKASAVASRAAAPKNSKPRFALWESLIADKDLQVGKQVFYQLTNEQGGNLVLDFPSMQTHTVSDAEAPRKTIAEIVYVFPEGTRGPKGQLIASLRIRRPRFRGGDLLIDAVEMNSSREPGTFDTIQPSDVGQVIGNLS